MVETYLLKNKDIFNFTEHNKESVYPDILVNPVNTIGISGKGLALEFKKRYNSNYIFYKECCDEKKLDNLRYNCYTQLYDHNYKKKIVIYNFPTKIHWKSNSDLKKIGFRLKNFSHFIHSFSKNENKKGLNVYMPALGCGLGGLSFEDFIKCYKKNFEEYFNSIDKELKIKVFLFEPL